MGKTVVINGRLLKITGIMDDIPRNSDLSFDGLLSMKSLTREDDAGFSLNYILFKSRSARDAFQPKLDRFAKNVVDRRVAREEGNPNTIFHYELEPLTSVHFQNSSYYDTPKGNKVSVTIFLTMGILILIIAFTNSLNMMVVKSFSRSVEVTMQKIYGARRLELIFQQLVESLALGITAAILSLLLAAILLPEFSRVLNRSITISDLLNWRLVVVVIAAVAVLGVSGALYTEFSLQRMKLADGLRSKSGKGNRLIIVPKLMLGLQFFISIGVIAAALVVERQVDYLRNAPLGFNPMNVLVVELPVGEHAIKGDKYLKSELSSDPDINMLSLCGENSLPGNFADLGYLEYRERNVLVRRLVDNIAVDNNYLTLLQVPIVAGEDFRPKADTFSRDEVIITQSFAKNAGWTNPLGQRVKVLGDADSAADVIGVVPDFHFNSLHNPIAPMVISQEPGDPAYLIVKAMNNKTSEVIKKMKEIWSKAFPAFPFYYYTLDQHILQQYKDDESLSALLLTFCSLIIVISCIGLIAYLSYIIRIAIAEIAIRRIIGASFKDLFVLLSKQFIFFMLIAFAVACPVSLYLLVSWLNQFAYHTPVKAGDFIIALGTMFCIVSGVVLYYTWQSIRINPAKILREQ
jgi:putative ABC transport system permease protein